MEKTQSIAPHGTEPDPDEGETGLDPELLTWIRIETERRIREEDFPKDEKLLPPTQFDDTIPPPEARCREPEWLEPSISGRLAAAMSGWALKPTMEKFVNAMRTAAPTDADLAVAKTVLCEGTAREIMYGVVAGHYSKRQLVQRLHDIGLTKTFLSAPINEWAIEDDL